MQSDSFRSPYPALDKHVRSRQILYVKKYPTVEFESTEIRRVGEYHYEVRGRLTMRGVTREIASPFELRFVDGKKRVEARGTWLINRKLFKIIWNPFLDHGGIIVGDHVTVDWTIVAEAESEKKD